MAPKKGNVYAPTGRIFGRPPAKGKPAPKPK